MQKLTQSLPADDSLMSAEECFDVALNMEWYAQTQTNRPYIPDPNGLRIRYISLCDVWLTKACKKENNMELQGTPARELTPLDRIQGEAETLLKRFEIAHGLPGKMLSGPDAAFYHMLKRHVETCMKENAR